MPAKVILNPYANRWMALERREEMIAALQAAGIEFDLVITQGPNHGTELAAQAVREGFSPIIAAGGDGSISEVVNGMVQEVDGKGFTVPLGVMPLGSANDLVDNLNLPRELEAAAKVIAGGQTRMMDICRVAWEAGGEKKIRYFDNNSAIGIEPFITLIQQRIQRIKGTPRYLVATLRGIYANPQWHMHLEWQDGSHEGPVSLVTIGNSPRTGGLFYVTPHADAFDGMLTFVYGFIPTRRQMLTVLPMMMKPDKGSYIEHPAIHEIHTPWLRIHLKNPTPMHADGEIQSETVTSLDYDLFSKRLPVLLP